MGMNEYGEPIAVPRTGAAVVASEAGLVTIRAVEDGGVQLEFDGDDVEVLLRVTEAIELHDGDLVCAGQQWMSFEAGRQGFAARLHQLDAQGEVSMTLALRGNSLSVGRAAGDVALPCDELLSPLHFQVLQRADVAFIQDLASEGGTWIQVRPGEVLPADSLLAVGNRMLRVNTPPPVDPEQEIAERPWRTSVYAYAHAAA